MKNKVIKDILYKITAFILLLFLIIFTVGKRVSKKSSYRVIKVIDGDTIVLDNGRHLRYIGIDTPEIDWKDFHHSDCYAWRAREINKKLVLGKKVTLQKDVSQTDKYGRLLRYVYVGHVFVNSYLVSHGYARVLTIPPDVHYARTFRELQRKARENKYGLWNPSICPQ